MLAPAGVEGVDPGRGGRDPGTHPHPPRWGPSLRAPVWVCLLSCLQGTPVVPLLSSVLLDKTQWETPHQFNPGHFLDAEGRFVRRAAFLPFSAGSRRRGGWCGPLTCSGRPCHRDVGRRFAGCRHCHSQSFQCPRLPLRTRWCLSHQAILPGGPPSPPRVPPYPLWETGWAHWGCPVPAGRRVCIGEALARSELFLLFAGLLQRYRLLPPPGLSPATLDTTPTPAFTMRPPAQALCAVPRNQGTD